MPDTKQTRLDQIAADIIADSICPDLAKTATQLVPGEGNPDADIVFIGEAPGRNEDITGKPFIGAAGKLLDELLATAGLNRDDVFITSIVKYRPPKNRDPLPAEKEAFWPYMMRQLDVIQPKVIVTLGRHSMGYFLPNKKISEVHGTPITAKVNNHVFVVLPLYHPAAVLYNNSMRQTLIDDFMQLPTLLKKV